MKQLELFPDLTTWTPEEEEVMQQMLATQGRKYDTGKPDYTLLPWDAVEEVVRVLDFGAKKYARDNWKHVEGGEQRYLAAAFRHLAASARGEQCDSETSISHLAHAACCVLFALSLEKTHE
jgi:hypothetical protein